MKIGIRYYLENDVCLVHCSSKKNEMSSEVREESGGEAACREAAQAGWDQEQVSTSRHEGMQQWMGEGKQQIAGLPSQNTNRF